MGYIKVLYDDDNDIAITTARHFLRKDELKMEFTWDIFFFFKF